MGYYTKYNLSVSKSSKELLNRIKNFPTAYGDNFFEDLLIGETDDIKWYEHEEDTAALSKEFPDILFTLSGEGEERGDIWKKYFKNGKMQVAKAIIAFDEFDESKLEEI